jgi:hypothetical protein
MIADEAEHTHTGAEPVAEEPIKVMLTPTTCGVMKFDSGQRMIVMTQGGVEISWPLGPGEAEQLSQDLHVSKIQSGRLGVGGLVLPT